VGDYSLPPCGRSTALCWRLSVWRSVEMSPEGSRDRPSGRRRVGSREAQDLHDNHDLPPNPGVVACFWSGLGMRTQCLRRPRRSAAIGHGPQGCEFSEFPLNAAKIFARFALVLSPKRPLRESRPPTIEFGLCPAPQSFTGIGRDFGHQPNGDGP
jgi:hypothetical protein